MADNRSKDKKKAKKKAEVEKPITLPNGKTIFATKSYRALSEKQTDNLFHDLLEDVLDSKAKGRMTKEGKSEKVTRLMGILGALREGFDTLKTFEFTSQKGFSDSIKATIYLYLFKGDQVVQGPDMIFKGSLNKTVELGKIAYFKVHKQSTSFDGVYLVTEINSKESSNPKSRKDNATLVNKKLYGIKSIFRPEDGDFIYGASSLFALNSEKECAKKLDFPISNPETWMGVRKHFDAFNTLTYNLQKNESITSGIPFIAFELSDESDAKDWEAVEEKFNLLKLFNNEGNEGDENLRYFVETLKNGSQQQTFPFLPRRCPISLKEYLSVEEHIRYLNKTFQFYFKSLPDGNIAIEKEENKTPDFDPIEENSAGFKPIPIAPAEPLKKILWPFHHEEEKVDMPPGKNTGWVKTKTQNAWREELTIRNMLADEEFPKECIDFCIEVNTHLNSDEFKYTNLNRGSIRLGYLSFFEKNFEKIIAEDNVLLVLGISSYLMNKHIFTSRDYAQVFDKFLEDRVRKQESEVKEAQGNLSTETPHSPHSPRSPKKRNSSSLIASPSSSPKRSTFSQTLRSPQRVAFQSSPQKETLGSPHQSPVKESPLRRSPRKPQSP